MEILAFERIGDGRRKRDRLGAPHASRLDEGLSFLVCWLPEMPYPSF